jgi:predicted KAP-like P-loop ATPase
MKTQNSPSFDADQINVGEQPDRLGFQAIAEKLAVSVLDQATAGGMVVGIEGRWGSGKSSLMGRLKTELGKRADAPEIVNFAPWLVGSRDGLITDLLAELVTAVKRIETKDASATSERSNSSDGKKKKSKAERAGEIRDTAEKVLASYAESVGRLGTLAKLAGVVVPGAAAAAELLDHGSEFMKRLGQPRELAEQKQKVALSLRALSRRIIVLIDDLDRLDPDEMLEVLRLVRAVADFPNVIYVLSFDGDAVAGAVESKFEVKDGREYLEKFIQVSFKVPKPEDFDLRRWFRDDATEILSEQLRLARESDQRDIARRLDEYIDVAGGRYLHTPRDVVRSLNALRLYAPAIADHVYLPDLVWLQLLRVSDSKLYDWVESYVTTVAAIADGAGTSGTGDSRALEQLKKILIDQDRTLEDAIWELQEILPGINSKLKDKDHPDGWAIFDSLTDDTLRKWISLRRLGSPQHFRYYFALAQPQGIIADAQVQHLIRIAQQSHESTSDLLREAATKKRHPGGVALDPLMSRLMALNPEELPKAAIPNLILGLADIADEASLMGGERAYGMDWLAIGAERAVRHLLERLDEAERDEVLLDVFGKGRSIGWLVGLLADDVYARGLGGKDKGSHEKYFTDRQFESARKIIVERLNSAPAEVILGVPRFIPVLLGWTYLGKPEDVKSWCAEQIKTDEGLLSFLSRSRGWANASGIGVYYPLNKRILSEFIDYDAARARIEHLAVHAQDAPIRRLAKELTTAFKQGARD